MRNIYLVLGTLLFVGFPGGVQSYEGGSTVELDPGEKASAKQREQLMQPGSVPAPPDQQDAEHITSTGKSEQPKDPCQGCKLIRGKVLLNDHDSLLVRDKSKQEIRLKLDTKTQVGQADPKNATFIEGDRIEALVTPDGRAWSVTVLKHQSNQPGVDAEGD